VAKLLEPTGCDLVEKPRGNSGLFVWSARGESARGGEQVSAGSEAEAASRLNLVL
jgi:hypothetical protein